MSDIKVKIQKILDKAASSTHEGEASVLLAKAEALMEKHQIEAFELGDNSDPVDMTYGVEGQSGPTAYKTHLQRALAGYYGCRAIRSWIDNRKWRLELVGPESARITTEMMTDFVWKQCNAEARKIAKDEGVKSGPIQRRIVNALVSRILKETAQREDAKPATKVAAKNALVVKNAVDAFVEKHYPSLTMTRGGRRSTSAAAQKAAAGISLHRQTGGRTVKRLT